MQAVLSRDGFLQLVRFMIVGVASALIDLGSLFILVERAGVWYLFASVIAFCLSYGVSSVFQKIWTFRNTDRTTAHQQFALHLILQLCNLALNTGAMYVLVEQHHLWYLMARVVVDGAIAIESFFIGRWIFRHRSA